jgi:hypothetical protein
VSRTSKISAVMASAPAPKTLSIPEAGRLYFGLSKNGAYDAAARGEIPYIRVGRLRRVPVAAMELMMREAKGHLVNAAPPYLETPAPASASAPAPRYPPSAAMRRKPRTVPA